jgi:hypothetical protein
MAIPSQDLVKICNKCKETKPAVDFYLRNGRWLSGACRKCTISTTKAHYQANRAEIRVQENAKMREQRKRVKEAVFAAYGGYVCACCGEREKAFLTLDHIANNGAKHRREECKGRFAAGYQTYWRLVKAGFPIGYQVLCMNCNWGKRMNGVCPHKVRCNDYSQEVGSSEPKRSTPVLKLVKI